MTQRKIVFTLAGLFVAILPSVGSGSAPGPGSGSSGAPAAAGAGASTSATGMVSASPGEANAAAPAPATVPAPPQLYPPREEHVRKGGFFRLALGSGYMFGTIKAEFGPKQRANALTFASDLSIGTGLGSGVAVGAAVYGTVPGYETDGQGPSFIMLACPFADVYVNPSDGFHLVGGPCYANARFEDRGKWLHGWGANLGIGYEWSALWGSNLGRGWGLGVLARVQYANLAGSGNADPFTAVMPSLLVSATWY